MGSIDPEIVNRSSNVSSAGMRRIGSCNMLGELQLMLSSGNAAICASSNLDRNILRPVRFLFAYTGSWR